MKTRVEFQSSNPNKSKFLDWLKKLVAEWPIYFAYSGVISCIIFFMLKPVLPGLHKPIYFLQSVVFYVLIISALICLSKEDKGHSALLLLLGILFVPTPLSSLGRHIYLCIFAIGALMGVINDLDKKRIGRP